MPTSHAQHPTPADLAAFAVGKLSSADAGAVAAHLADCPNCRLAAERAHGDSFVARVQAAGLSHPTDATALPGSRRPSPAAPGDLPPELANHPRYMILRELGRGGMGIVYQARQTVMNRPVVIKVISKALLDHPDAVERFRREVQAAAKLAHPNIVTAYDAEQAGELHMLVMKFVPGQSLAEALHKKGPLPVLNACVYVRQAALGLQHAHEQGMVHRDIKPHNLMLTPKGQVKILDFGLAKMVSERASGTGLTDLNSYMGTPDYCAPEQATDARSADIRADIYSLGCTLYCLLAGRPPFREETAVQTILAHLEKEPTPLPQLRSDVPADLWAVVARMLAKDPARRYQKPAELAQALAPFCKRGAWAAPAPRAATHAKSTPAAPLPGQSATQPERWQPAPVTAEPSADRRWWLGGLAVALVCVLGLGVCLIGALLYWAGQHPGKSGERVGPASGKSAPVADGPGPSQSAADKPPPSSAKGPALAPAPTARVQPPEQAGIPGLPKPTKHTGRWHMFFNTYDGDDYLRHLRDIKPGRGGMLATPAGGAQFEVIRDLSKKPAAGKVEDLRQLKTTYWIEDRPQSVADLAKALGIKPPPYFVVIFPSEMEEELERLEREKSGGAQEDDIIETVFDVVQDGNVYRPRCRSVELKPGATKAPAQPGEPAKPQPDGKNVPADEPAVADPTTVKVQAKGSFTSTGPGPLLQLTIRQGDKFQVDVSADDNLGPLIKTPTEGSVLRIVLDTGGKSVKVDSPPKVTVTMPALEGVHLDLNCLATIDGFQPGKEFQDVLGGKSTLKGRINADRVNINATDAEVTLSGSAKELDLKAVGGRLRLADLAADNATVEMTGPAEAEIQVKEHLDYNLIGPGHLEYRGSPAVGKAKIVGPGRVNRAGP
jgi:tRNA A-37 threonylcarbamoyl transferase component Bud32